MADGLKAEGNEAYRGGNWGLAVEKYTAAMAADASNPVYATNRAAAYLQLGDFAASIADCEGVLGEHSGHAKAYSLKGTALLRQGRTEAAIAAYQLGLQHCPEHVTLKNNLEAARAEGKPAAPAPAATGGEAPATAAPGPGIVQYLVSGPGSAQNTIHAVLRLIAFAYAVLYLASFGASRMAWSRCMQATVGSQVLSLYRMHGRPQFAMQYAARVVPSRELFVTMACVVFMFLAPSMFLAMVPLVAVDMFCLVEFVYGAALALGSAFSTPLAAVGSKILASVTGSAATYAQRRQTVYQRLLAIVCDLEIYIGFFLVLSMNLFAAVVYFQMMKIRFLMAPECKTAWRSLDAKLLSLVSSPSCPSLVGTLYNQLRRLVSWFGQPPQAPAAGGGGGLASKCTIM